MKTFKRYVREHTGLSFYDCCALNVDEDVIRNLFADWIKEDKQNKVMIANALDIIDRVCIDFDRQ